MSKKKVGGNTMTLKDFHGGSIPTDLPLPAAPGVNAKPADRIGHNRPTAWVNPIGRSDLRVGTHSSPATGNFDDRSPFFTQPALIGRNFDEDERKPVNGAIAPRRTVSDDSVRLLSSEVTLKPGYATRGGSSGRQGDSPMYQSDGVMVNSYLGWVPEGIQSGTHQNSGAKKEPSVGDAYPNAWGIKKEATRDAESEQSVWSCGVTSVAKLAHASAIEKVSSGMWHSKTGNNQTDVAGARLYEGTKGSQFSLRGNGTYKKMELVDGKEHFDAMLATHAEKGLHIMGRTQDTRSADKEMYGAYRQPQVRDKTTAYHVSGAKPAGIGVKNWPENLPSAPPEPSQRPKLNLLPRTRPLEISEPTVANYAQFAYEPVSAEPINEVFGNSDSANLQSGNIESGKQLSQRPKLNLKPRSQPNQRSEGNFGEGMYPLFGGARPRELVLKERGVDDVAVNFEYESVDKPKRVEQNVKTGRVDLASPKQSVDRGGHARFDQKVGKKTERKEPGIDVERDSTQRRSWRSDNRRSNIETGRQQPTRRQTSPETWRKPAEQSKPSIHDGVGLQHGKVASAVDLVQAFSRSVSQPTMNNRVPGQRVPPGSPHVPFSRLVDSMSPGSPFSRRSQFVATD